MSGLIGRRGELPVEGPFPSLRGATDWLNSAQLDPRLIVHRVEGPGGEEPFKQPILGVPERRVETLSLAGAEPVERDGEVVHANL
jgi:hypothetical protein